LEDEDIGLVRVPFAGEVLRQPLSHRGVSLHQALGEFRSLTYPGVIAFIAQGHETPAAGDLEDHNAVALGCPVQVG
jgi:hypothetical protein